MSDTALRSTHQESGLTLHPDTSPLDSELRTSLAQQLVAARHLDLSAIAWQRQGIIPGYAPEHGQEAAQIGSARAMEKPTDFLFPTYREMAAALAWGLDMVDYMSTHKATWHGGLYDPMAEHFAPIQAVVAGSVLHAVGWAHGQRLAATDATNLPVALSYFGDGASSQGDVHEAMNFAGVFKAPVIFFVQNNGWAISVPTERQVAGGSVAARAAGYGIPAMQVDGNDVEAVYQATRAARAHAAAGNGPVVIEAMTYRRGPHSTSDDPGRYRTLDAERENSGADPVTHQLDRLKSESVIDQAFIDSAEAAAKELEETVRAGVEKLQSRPGREMFDFVFAEETRQLKDQRAAWAKESENV